MNNVFISAHPQMALYGALATKQKFVNGRALLRHEDLDRLYNLEDEDDVILVFSGANDVLTPDERQAILAHEEGHFYHGHLKGLTLEAGVLDNLPKELEADAYAIAKCGARVLYKALRKTILASARALAAQDELSSAEVFRMLRNFAEDLQPRFAAMRAAM